MQEIVAQPAMQAAGDAQHPAPRQRMDAQGRGNAAGQRVHDGILDGQSTDWTAPEAPPDQIPDPADHGDRDINYRRASQPEFEAGQAANRQGRRQANHQPGGADIFDFALPLLPLTAQPDHRRAGKTNSLMAATVKHAWLTG